MMRALLVNPHVPLEAIYGKSVEELGAVLPQLGIFYLASYLNKKNKHEVEILDANALKMSADALVRHVSNGRYGCVGFTSTTLAYAYAIEAAEQIKKAHPKTTLIIGGAHAQGDSDNILKNHPGLFDYVCYGEGEYAFESLLDYLDGTIKEDDLIGWKYLQGNAVKTSPPAPIPDNLDLFGHPAELLPKEWVNLYHEKIFAYKKLPMFGVMSSRGCPFQCMFCSTPRKFANLYQRRMRYHSVPWICDELQILENRFGVQEVIFLDDTFNLNKKRVLDFCQMKMERGIKLIWSCNFEANIADHEMMKTMKEAGCWLKLVGKLANQVGIVSRVSCILGFPNDTRQTIEDTVKLIRESDFHFPYFQLYIPLPGTEMYELLPKYGKVVNTDTKKRSASNVNYIPRGLTAEYLLDVYKKAFKASYFRFRMVRNHIKFIRSFKDVKHYYRGLRLLANF
ncbi:MAG: cobalamin B12-binding domain-containing protein [Elusimicrobia bacterium]|nr:cobalamin B12-binding domain-containing protein [Elusimicrobiota bacterium]